MQESGRAQSPVNWTGKQQRRSSNLGRPPLLPEIGAQARWQNMLAPVYGIEVVAARAVCNYKVRIVSRPPKVRNPSFRALSVAIASMPSPKKGRAIRTCSNNLMYSLYCSDVFELL